MESPSIPSSGIFSLHVLIILGVTVALVSAVAVILYNKIQQQGEKLSAVMELSTVLAQELRSHDSMLKHLQNPAMTFSGKPSASPPNVVFVKPETDDDIERIYVSDGSGESENEFSINDIDEPHHHIQPITLDNILMNPMCFGSGTKIIDETISGNESSEDESSEDESSEDESSEDESSEDESSEDEINTEQDIDDTSIDGGSLLSCIPDELTELNLQEDEGVEKRTIKLSEVSVNYQSGEEEEDNDAEVQSNIHKVAMDVEDIIDYKKIAVNELRRIAIERQLIDKGSKMKKTELIELLASA